MNFPLWLRDEESALDAQITVSRWGYPRPLEASDYAGEWFTFGPDLIFWFEATEDSTCAGWHMVIRPEARSRVFARPYLESVRISACLLGIERLYIRNPPEIVESYLQRLGLEQDEIGYFWSVRDTEVKRHGGSDQSGGGSSPGPQSEEKPGSA